MTEHHARVAFVGLGRMGLPMARRMRDAGYEVTGIEIDAAARERAAAAGLPVHATPEAAAGSEVVCSSLPDTAAVQTAYLGNGLLSIVDPGTVCVDLSTIAVEASVDLAATAAAAGIRFLDCPVGGTTIHAEAGTLVLTVGGEAGDLEAVRPVLETVSRSIHHIGPHGAGLRMKLTANRLLATHLAAIGDAILEMEAAGIGTPVGITALRDGPVPRLLEYKAEPMAQRDLTPLFTIDLMRKDLRLAAEHLPAGRLGKIVEEVFDAAAAAGRGGYDVVAIIEPLASERSLGEGTS